MSNRRRKDGELTADELKERAQRCPGFMASDADELVCVRCQAHKELHPPAEEDGIDNLAETLPPGDGPSVAEQVAERQADAATDSAPAVGEGGAAPAGEGDNSKSRYQIITEKTERLTAIKAEQKKLREEAEEIIDDMEKNQGVNRGALGEIRKLLGLDAATVKAKEASRKELFDLLVAPKLEEATEGETRE